MVTQLPVKELIVGSNPTRGARIKLASESRKLARPGRSAAQGGEAVSWTSVFCKCRFEPKIFWREDFLEGMSSDCAASSSNEASITAGRALARYLPAGWRVVTKHQDEGTKRNPWHPLLHSCIQTAHSFPANGSNGKKGAACPR